MWPVKFWGPIYVQYGLADKTIVLIKARRHQSGSVWRLALSPAVYMAWLEVMKKAIIIMTTVNAADELYIWLQSHVTLYLEGHLPFLLSLHCVLCIMWIYVFYVFRSVVSSNRRQWLGHIYVISVVVFSLTAPCIRAGSSVSFSIFQLFVVFLGGSIDESGRFLSLCSYHLTSKRIYNLHNRRRRSVGHVGAL